jgi:hypothetical protein
MKIDTSDFSVVQIGLLNDFDRGKQGISLRVKSKLFNTKSLGVAPPLPHRKH